MTDSRLPGRVLHYAPPDAHKQRRWLGPLLFALILGSFLVYTLFTR